MGKRVLITGGARGIGASIAARFVTSGHEVLKPSREKLDLSQADSIAKYFEKESAIDILINNAGINIISPLESASLADWQHILMVNLTAPFLLIQQVIPHMTKQRWGRIINIGSVFSCVSREGRCAYSAAKSGLNGLTRTAALEYGKYNILVNQVCPGYVSTDLTYHNNTAEQIEALTQQIPLRRLITTEEVAEYAYFLGSEQNTCITGQIAIIDGGLLCQ